MADNLEKIKKETLKTHRVQGKYNGVKWQLILAYRNKDSNKLEENADSAARFNEASNNNIVAFWPTLKDLEDYEKKLEQNRNYIKNNLESLERQLPDSLRGAATERSIESIKETYAQKTRDIYKYQPNAPILLAESASCAYNFSLEEIEGIIDRTVKNFISDFGGFPTKPQLIDMHPGWSGFQVALKIWRDN